MHHPRTGIRAAVALTVILAAAGCGSSPDTAGSAAALANQIAQAAASASVIAATADVPDLPTDDTEPVVESEPSVETSAAAPPVTRSIDKTGWYDGFAVTVDEVTAEPGYDTDMNVTVDVTFENLGIEDFQPPRGSVEADGLVVDAYFDTPDIPAGGKAKGTTTFTVQPEETRTPDEIIDGLVLVYGDTGDNQTTVPLAADAEVDSIEPRELAVTGNLTLGQIVVDVVGATMAPSYESGEKGKALLNVRIKLACAADCIASGWNTGYEQFSVTRPDGDSVIADQRSEYCCDALYPGVVSDNERNIVTFIVPLPGDGKYTLTYDNPNITSTGVAPATLDFTA